MTVSCSLCGETWPRDPALEVACPTCHAPAGVRCKRPSGHGCEIHVSRDQAAMAAGFLRRCPKNLSTPQAPLSGQLALF